MENMAFVSSFATILMPNSSLMNYLNDRSVRSAFSYSVTMMINSSWNLITLRASIAVVSPTPCFPSIIPYSSPIAACCSISARNNVTFCPCCTLDQHPIFIHWSSENPPSMYKHCFQWSIKDDLSCRKHLLRSKFRTQTGWLLRFAISAIAVINSFLVTIEYHSKS